MITLPIIIKQKSKWIFCILNGNNIIKKDIEFKKLNDITKNIKYQNISKYISEKKKKFLLKKYNTNSIYVLEYPIRSTKKEFEKWWWSFYNKKCLKCKKICKQSHKVSLIYCKGYRKK